MPLTRFKSVASLCLSSHLSISIDSQALQHTFSPSGLKGMVTRFEKGPQVGSTVDIVGGIRICSRFQEQVEHLDGIDGDILTPVFHPISSQVLDQIGMVAKFRRIIDQCTVLVQNGPDPCQVSG